MKTTLITGLVTAALLVLMGPTPTLASVGYLYVESDPPLATVEIDGDPTSACETPATFTLAPGLHKLTIRKMYYKAKTVTIQIEADQVLRKTIQFKAPDKSSAEPAEGISVHRQYGNLTVITDRPGAWVYVDDKKYTVPTPVTLNDLTAGDHAIRVAQNGRVSIRSVEILPDTTVVLQADVEDFEPQAEAIAEEFAIAETRIELSSCQYRRDTSLGGQRTIAIHGVDPHIQIVAGDRALRLSHHPLAEAFVVYNHRGEVIEKELRDTTLSHTLACPIDEEFRFDVVVYASPDRWSWRTTLTPTRKSYRVPANFNNGEPVNVRIRVDRDGTVVFRYW